VTIIAVLMIVTTVVDFRRERSLLREDAISRGLLLSRTLGDVLADPLYFSDVDALDDAAALLRSQSDVEYVRIFDKDGRILADSEQQNYPGEVSDALGLSAIQTNQTLTQSGSGTLNVAAPISE
jgi:hypothetical protein